MLDIDASVVTKCITKEGYELFDFASVRKAGLSDRIGQVELVQFRVEVDLLFCDVYIAIESGCWNRLLV